MAVGIGHVIEDCVAGRISPEVAIAQALFAGGNAAAIREALQAAPPHARQTAMLRLLEGRETGIDALAAEVAATAAEHDASGATAEAGIGRIARFFDRAVAYSPEASVALYSLGDPAILAAATAEIVEWLAGQRLLPPDADVLDLGCGHGRVAAVLAPRCRSVLGLDVSAGMVAEARRRHAGLANVRFEQTGGQDLAGLPGTISRGAPAPRDNDDASSTAPEQAFDLVLAIDSFPYIVQTGDAVASQHVADAARLLRPGGALCILNLSYRNDDALDRADAARWAEHHGFTLAVADPQPFQLWDGSAYVLRR